MMNFRILRWASTHNIGSDIMRSIKCRSHIIMKIWLHQCDHKVAHSIHRERGHQFFRLYDKVVSGISFQKMVQSIRNQVHRRCSGLLISSVGVFVFNWETERIKYDTVKSYFNEFELMHKLQKDTIYCSTCEKQRQISGKIDDVDYCKCTQVNNTSAKNCWEPYLEREGMIIWRKEENSSLYSYKVYAKYYDITANDFLHVQTDLEYRKKWDDSAVTLDIVDTDPNDKNGSHVIYWEMKWPKLFVNRDYVYCRKYFVDKSKNVVVICSQSTNHPKYPVNPNKQRVEEYWSYMVVKPFNSFHEPGLEYILTYYDNPGLAIPSTITSWVAQKQLPQFLEKLYAATKVYAQQKKLFSKKFSLKDSFKNDDIYSTTRTEGDNKHHTRQKPSQTQDRKSDGDGGLTL